MENSSQLAQRFREVILNGKWIANTNFQEQTAGINWEQATKKPSGLNSIAALVFHINYYIEGINTVFNGGALEIRDKFSFDCPPIKTQSQWDELRAKLIRNAEHFAKKVELLSDDDLAESFVDEKYGSMRRNIEGVIEHSYYHLGQLSLIKKMILKEV